MSARPIVDPRSRITMLLLGFHIVSVGMLILIVGVIAYRMGFREGVRRTNRALEESGSAS